MTYRDCSVHRCYSLKDTARLIPALLHVSRSAAAESSDCRVEASVQHTSPSAFQTESQQQGSESRAAHEQHQQPQQQSPFNPDPLYALASICTDPLAGGGSGESMAEKHSTSKGSPGPHTCSTVSTSSRVGLTVQPHHASSPQQCSPSRSHQQHIDQAPAQEGQCIDASVERLKQVHTDTSAASRQSSRHGPLGYSATSEAAFDAGVNEIVRALCPMLEGIACKFTVACELQAPCCWVRVVLCDNEMCVSRHCARAVSLSFIRLCFSISLM
jgi:hypothetical protein